MEIKNLILSEQAIDAIDNGVWVRDLPGMPGLELLVTGLGSQDAQAVMKQKQEKMRQQNQGEPLSDDQQAQCTKEVLAEVVLRGWRGFTENGVPVEYSQELAKKWLFSRAGERFLGLVLRTAQRVDSQANALVEAAAKN